MRSAEGTGANAGDTLSICSLRVGTGLFGIDTRQIREVPGIRRRRGACRLPRRTSPECCPIAERC